MAKEIVERGHEAAAHGMDWATEYNMSYEDERKFIADGVDEIRKTTGTTPIGYNSNFLRRGENTLTLLQEMGFIYHDHQLW